MARRQSSITSGQEQNRAAAGSDNDWYQRWISDVADDVASDMRGEQEREERMKALRLRLDQLRSSFKQLHGGQRGRGPRSRRPTQMDVGEDARILSDVYQCLAEDWFVDASEIDIAVSGGEVTLSAAVDSRAAKRLAADCADSIPGVRDVHNQLQIRPAD